MTDRTAPEEEPDTAATEAGRVYLHLKSLLADEAHRGARRRRSARRKKDADTEPFGPGREPKGLGDALDTLTDGLGWQSRLAQSELLVSWATVAGEEVARHSHPEGITDGQLTIRCTSTAWATQLRLMRADILTRIATGYPDAGILGIRFLGPDAPSWKKGPRSIPGRGPRDTYG